MLYPVTQPVNATALNLVHNDVGDTFAVTTTEDEIPFGVPIEGNEYMYLFLANWADETHMPLSNPNVTLVSSYSPSGFWQISPTPTAERAQDSKHIYSWIISDLPEEGTGKDTWES